MSSLITQHYATRRPIFFFFFSSSTSSFDDGDYFVGIICPTWVDSGGFGLIAANDGAEEQKTM